jgi:hypothetical protein
MGPMLLPAMLGHCFTITCRAALILIRIRAARRILLDSVFYLGVGLFLHALYVYTPTPLRSYRIASLLREGTLL